ncbi:NAD-dependent epimerase/dehydratase family protein [Chelativorans sp. AA-79]|uniref:SPW repeat domain-containing protein n=1 Tax=Chelativorans sp. AA-79 TaxID=3028735 RepID=UPI0023F8E741|nr:NAD-dependent epimerase/dehydratase family protein [Chelativorans sp. AA-79]WEX11006.1 NAD-dependent epimerase/dehydratase family protein [Chelativorans sp. AA-79]
MAEKKDTVIITGGSGFLGRALVAKLRRQFDVVSLDLKAAKGGPEPGLFVEIDLTSDDSVKAALERVREHAGNRIASVIHLAAYFDLTGEQNTKYDEITVRGTGRLLDGLQSFEVEQFVFASTMLVHQAARPGEKIDESRPLDPKLPYRASKVETEEMIAQRRGSIPVVYLRPAGVYDNRCSNPFLAHQISRIYERSPKARAYPGDLETGQSFLHLDDFAEAILRLVERRGELPPELPLLLGEPETIGYGEMQREIGRLIHEEPWETWHVPKPLAKTGVWMEEEVLDEDSFIKPWMVDIADDHYALDITRARTLLGWEPAHSLRETLPGMIEALKADPHGWYRANKLNASKVAGQGRPVAGHPGRDGKAMQGHMHEMAEMRLHMLWVHFLVVALGVWLLTSPFQFALFNPEIAAGVAHDVTQERGLWEPALRNAITGWNEIVCGLLLILFGSLALNPRLQWAQWGTTIVGLWLLFAPLFFWTPSAAAYANDTIVGALAITFSVLVPMMPGMSHEGMMDESEMPAGWTYSPSSWLQRLPIIALGLFGFFVARYLAAYQLGHVDHIWEPFFSGDGTQNGTESIITSDVSRAWPIPDAGLGATSYMIEALMGVMGSSKRWRTMPWMVAFFFILVVPLGGVSIFFIVIQPIVIGTYCTLCLIAAFAMLVMIPLTVDEVVAMGQYMMRSHRAGRPLIRTFLQGGPDAGGKADDRAGFGEPLRRQAEASVLGVTVPWTLVASSVLGAWLMFSRLVFGTEGAMADSDHLVGAMIITVAVIAMAEVARPLRFLNVFFGLWLIAAPWMLSGATAGAAWNGVICGLLAIALSLPLGTRSSEHYGSWDRYVF